jgi:hypothetical protein
MITMTDMTTERPEDDVLAAEISDTAIEAAATPGNPGGFLTQFAYCTNFGCPA